MSDLDFSLNYLTSLKAKYRRRICSLVGNLALPVKGRSWGVVAKALFISASFQDEAKMELG